jgi:hypothetical protein
MRVVSRDVIERSSHFRVIFQTIPTPGSGSTSRCLGVRVDPESPFRHVTTHRGAVEACVYAGDEAPAIDSAWRPRYFNSFHPWHVAAPAEVAAKEAVRQHIYELTP